MGSQRMFPHAGMQKVYEYYTHHAPTDEVVKLRGACGNAYWVGRFVPDGHLRPFARRGSYAYAAWAAGVDLRRQEKR